jgi:hypothetical protein
MSARAQRRVIDRAPTVTPSNLRSSPIIPDHRCAASRVPRRRVSIACGGIEGRRVVGEPTEANHDDDASIHSGPRLIEPPPASVTYNLV